MMTWQQLYTIKYLRIHSVGILSMLGGILLYSQLKKILLQIEVLKIDDVVARAARDFFIKLKQLPKRQQQQQQQHTHIQQPILLTKGITQYVST
jgi:transposase-like protein